MIAAAQRLLSESTEAPIPAGPAPGRRGQEVHQPALPLFEPEPDPLRAELEALDLDRTTPLEALAWLAARKGARP